MEKYTNWQSQAEKKRQFVKIFKTKTNIWSNQREVFVTLHPNKKTIAPMIIILKLDKRANKEDVLSTLLEVLLGSPLNVFATLENNLFGGDGYILQTQIIQLKSIIFYSSFHKQTFVHQLLDIVLHLHLMLT